MVSSRQQIVPVSKAYCVLSNPLATAAHHAGLFVVVRGDVERQRRRQHQGRDSEHHRGLNQGQPRLRQARRQRLTVS